MTDEGSRVTPLPPARLRHRWSELVPVLVMAVLLASALFRKLFVSPFFYFSTDNAELYFAWLAMLSRALHRGYWPFLNPYAFAGSLPFASLESGAMYPVTLLAALVTSPSWSLDSVYLVFLGLSILHYVLGACAMYVLLRRSFVLSATAATFGALCYAFGGSFLGRFSHQPVLHTLAWLPLAVAGALAFARAGRFRSAVLALVAVWLMGVSSHPHIFLYGFAVVAAAVAWFSLTQERSLRWGAFRRGAIILALAVGLLAPRLLPLYELAQVTVRPASPYTIAKLFDSLSPSYYMTLVVPNLFGRHIVGYWGSDHPLGNWGSLVYIGVLPAVCALFSFFHKPRRDWGFALVGAAAAAFLMLGKYCAPSAWINQHLPLSDVLTDLSKLTVVFHFFAVLLAAFGLQAVLMSKGRPWIVLVASLVALAMAGLFVWLSPQVAAGLAPAERHPPSEEAVRFAWESVRQARWLALAALVTLCAGIFAPRVGRKLVIPVLVTDLALSLGTFNPIEATKGAPATYYGGDAASRFMQSDRDTFRVGNVVPPNGGMVLELEAIWGYHTVATSAFARIHRFLDFHDRRDRHMYNLANIKYQRASSDLSSYNFTQVAPGLWLNREVLARAFFVGRCRGFKDTDAMTGSILSRSFEPSRELMLFESDCRPGPEAEGSCTLRSAAESRERYSADCTVGAGGGWAFFSVMQYPGWRSTVNGQAATLVPANIAFYAVPLSAGRHRVELAYRSDGLLYGLWIAAGTALLALGSAGWYAWRRPRRGAR